MAVVGSGDRRDERQADGDCDDDDEPSALTEEPGQRDANHRTYEGPPRERREGNGFVVDFETDVGSACDGCHDGGADRRDCADERAASNKSACAHRGGERRERSHRYAASLRCVARLSKMGITSAIIWAKNSFSQSAPLP